MAGLQKLDVAAIILGHWKTLKDDRRAETTGASLGDVTVFYIAPSICALGLVIFGIYLSPNALQVLTTALSIMAALLFNLIVLIHGLAKDDSHPRVIRFALQVHDNIAYAIVVALVALVPLVVAANYNQSDATKYLGYRVANGLVIALAGHFALTMIMVLKRMYLMLKAQFPSA